MRVLGCGLRVGLGEAELTRGTAGMLSCSMLLERPPFTSRPTLFRPMEEKKRRRKSFGRPSSFLHIKKYDVLQGNLLIFSTSEKEVRMELLDCFHNEVYHPVSNGFDL